MQITASISPNGKRIYLRFPYNEVVIRQVKGIPGGSWVKSHKAWSFPLELRTAEELRLHLGDRLQPTPELRAWGIAETRKLNKFIEWALADDADELKIDTIHPELATYLRPYQRADARLMASRSVINANQPGLGKTVEVVAASLEAGLRGRHLVLCPVASIDTVWLPEITRWLPDDERHSGQSPIARQGAVVDAAEDDGPCWCVVNPESLRKESLEAALNTSWDTVTIDEFDRFGLSNPKTIMSQAMGDIDAKRIWPLSGTPMGGKALNLWAVLNILDPLRFGSKWRWAEQWLAITENPFGKDIGELKRGIDKEFYRHHTPWMIRRLKREAMPWLPPKIRQDVWCDMTKKQAAQYRQFEQDGEVLIDEKRIVGTSILAEYTRRKQFAFSLCDVRGDKVIPTEESGKLAALWSRLQHHGIDRKGGEWAVVASQHTEVCEFVHSWLERKGVPAALYVGGVDKRKRDTMVNDFQSGKGARVMVINTKAGGVSINLDRADTMHILDETWNPDDQEQLEGRIDNRSGEVRQRTMYYYRSNGTIDEYIQSVTGFKIVNNSNILDVRREMLRAHGG